MLVAQVTIGMVLQVLLHFRADASNSTCPHPSELYGPSWSPRDLLFYEAEQHLSDEAAVLWLHRQQEGCLFTDTSSFSRQTADQLRTPK